MENLKFRAWDKLDKEMLEVHGINFDAKGIWTREMIDDESDGNFVFLDEVVLLQSTGLKDKNDIEIFEGDIIEEPYNSCPFRNSTLRSIEMYDGAWVARDIKEPVLGEISVSLSILRGSKVIGNIYENEDLK